MTIQGADTLQKRFPEWARGRPDGIYLTQLYSGGRVVACNREQAGEEACRMAAHPWTLPRRTAGSRCSAGTARPG
ncbi:hypothetical protein [Burkholderia alba]|uniref:hypothetical protein n=1 Tax=Burkholderia alba TaxID=2683677 RepID=UPI002B05C2F8|nr:hypothetical protein [Burkholderia alba]